MNEKYLKAPWHSTKVELPDTRRGNRVVCYNTFCNIPADTYQEAAQIAKRRFIRRYWNRKLLKAHMETKSDNLL